MATQTLEFTAASGLALSCKLFALESDTVVDTQAAMEKTNDKNRYTVEFTDVPAGAYRLNAFVGSVGGFANEVYDLTLATDVFLPRSELSGIQSLLSRIPGTIRTATEDATAESAQTTAIRNGLATSTNVSDAQDAITDILGTPAGASIAADIAAIEGGGGGAGTGARTVTITVNDGSTPLQNATVRLTEGANTFTATTNASGVATFNVDDATYTVAISKSGYSYSGTTLVVDGDETATYSMTLISISAPDDPSLCACAIYVKDQKGVAVESATVKTIIQSVDAVFVDETLIINTTGTATTNANGLATINLIQGQTYEITVSVASQEKSSFDYTVPAESTARINVTA